MNYELSSRLASMLDSLSAVDADDAVVEEAQLRLRRSLAMASPPRRRAAVKWLSAAAAACTAIVAMLVASLGPTVAFADVQQHFAIYRTLSFVLDTRSSGESIQQMHVFTNADGDVRTDIGQDVSVVVNARQHQVLTLLHGAHAAMRFPVAASRKDDPLQWLKEIRDYKQAAESLGTKKLEGVTAHGWHLQVAGMDTELWASDDGLPLQMLVKQAPNIELDFRFTFDQELSADLFSTEVPKGYVLGKAED